MGRTVNLGRGQIVPYPEPSSPEATAVGKANRRTGTKPEVELRRALHATGLRFRKDLLIRAGGTRTRADVVFPKQRLAVFVDGCFWHVCPEHFHMPKTNLGYWEPKLQANIERDARVSKGLSADGWQVVRCWEHVGVDDAVRVVAAALVGLGHVRAGELLAAASPVVAPPP
ncbi:very short patch repair endonuclease [Iamia sp.]|uniref:very short patch repair endonuclease n=1 Tax=Iamia sp. TaxID=2722710 RepID=UPI002D0F3038|nr:very short patch repair endonuclease [Iamia sp.]HXH59136.1 very short patch repair endonuclease [Iamia sp.]